MFGGASAIFLVLDVAEERGRARFRNQEEVQFTRANSTLQGDNE